MTYAVLNAAYQAMAPQMEGWTVRVVVYPPFHFGDVSHVTMIKATGDRDSLMIFPLEREMPEPFEKKPRVLTLEDIENAVLLEDD